MDLRALLLSMVVLLLVACGETAGGGGTIVPNDTTTHQDTASPDDTVGPLPDTTGDTVIDTSPTPDGAMDTSPADTVLPDLTVPAGYGSFCGDDPMQCKLFDLTCFADGADDLEAMCSTTCEAGSDCPEALICAYKAGQKICRAGTYCEPCTYDAQCGDEGVCYSVDDATRFCTIHCTMDGGQCAGGSLCKKASDEADDFVCMPKSNTCVGDGYQCSPCTNDADCRTEHVCFTSATGEQFCSKECTADTDCTGDSACFETLAGQLCFPTLEGQPVDSCYAGQGEFCEPCAANVDCRSGVCFSSNPDSGDQRTHCSLPCEDDEDCLSGTFCTPNFNGEEGSVAKACSPPIAYGCQGFKNCLGVECDDPFVCEGGFCVNPYW